MITKDAMIMLLDEEFAARQPRQFMNQLGTCWITDAAIKAIGERCNFNDIFDAAREIMLHGQKAWEQLQHQEIGQSEIILPGEQLALHFAVNEEGTVLADIEPWLPYE